MAFAIAWSAGYEAIPADTENASLGASRIRDLKLALRERMEIDHEWEDDPGGGMHKQVSFLAPLGSDPSTVANRGYLYTKDVSAKVELFWKDEDGNVLQLTTGGLSKGAKEIGEVWWTSDDSVPAGSLSADGSAVSRTTYADLNALYSAAGYPYGNGDGSTTFNLPDLDGRSPIGEGTGDATNATAWTLGEKGGDETHTLTESEMPSHTHSVPQGGDRSSSTGYRTSAAQDSRASQTTGSKGGDQPHNNMHPVLGLTACVFTGVF